MTVHISYLIEGKSADSFKDMYKATGYKESHLVWPAIDQSSMPVHKIHEMKDLISKIEYVHE